MPEPPADTAPELGWTPDPGPGADGTRDGPPEPSWNPTPPPAPASEPEPEPPDALTVPMPGHGLSTRRATRGDSVHRDRPPEVRGVIGQAIGARADNASRVYRSGDIQVTALHDLSMEIAPGEFVAITGPSGCGKSTLLNLLGGLDRPTSGTIYAAGQPLDQLPTGGLDDYRLLRVGTVFQFFNLIPNLTAVENVALPMLLAGIPEQERTERARWLLGLVGLDHRATFMPGHMSGGEQQRVAIARALANQPGLILADEPTGNLDSFAGDNVLSLLRDLNRRGVTVILVTHDAEIARNADRAIRLRDGRLASDTGGGRQAARAPMGAPEPTRLILRDAFWMGLQGMRHRPGRLALTAAAAVLGVALAALVLSLQTATEQGHAAAWVAAIALVVAGFGLVNTMLASVLDRTREVGIMKALGARVRDIAAIFAAEATTIGIAAAVGGPVLAFVLGLVGNLLVGDRVFELSLGIVIATVLLALFLSLCSAILPALRAARISPARALRYE
ncbi:MAG: ATP-binding cassette domain-containing protein [Candidatus Dormibacteraeota bacterium]|nr:ATP-binding cassette domain-containing protein [Candidatus Dormibacteraeota bacterium]